MTILNRYKKPLAFHFDTDPDHGWLGVKRDLLPNLGRTTFAIRACGCFSLTDTEKEILSNGQRPGAGQ
ncbi:MAG: hypothetical protein HOO93_06825 [Methyloglobulus sp.]|nr:hypothetical protein [Methyloglobulus sp.]